MNMKHNKFLMVGVGFLFFGAQHLSADPVAMGFDGLQAQAQNSLAATRAQFQSQEPFSEEAQLSTPQKSTATRKSADMPAVEVWVAPAARAAVFIAGRNPADVARAGTTVINTAKNMHERHKERKANSEKCEKVRVKVEGK